MRSLEAVFCLCALLECGCIGAGYRSPEDSAPMARAIGDKNLATRVRIALERDPRTERLDQIEVSAKDGVVTLRGVVTTVAHKRRLFDVVRHCRGVTGVEDRIRIGRG